MYRNTNWTYQDLRPSETTATIWTVTLVVLRSVRWRHLKREDGQSIILTMLALPLLLAVSALVVDGSNLFVQHQSAQNTADAVALAIANSDLPCPSSGTGACLTDAQYYGAKNGVNDMHACANSTDNDCYQWPYNGNVGQVEVRITKNPQGFFAPAVFGLFGGGGPFKTSARAVASAFAAQTPQESFVAFSSSNNIHSLFINNAGTLTVTNRIYLNSTNQSSDAFDIFNNGSMYSPHIYLLHSGWDNNNRGNVYTQAGMTPPAYPQTPCVPGTMYPPNKGCPELRSVPTSDPFLNYPTPATGSAATCPSASAMSATVSFKARNNNVATLTTSSAHGFGVGDVVAVSGVDSTFDGSYSVSAVPSPTTFSYLNNGVTVPPLIDVTQAQLQSNVATLTTSIPHGFFVGDKVYIQGVGAPYANGIYPVTAVPSPTTFSFSLTGGNKALAAVNGDVGYSIATEQLTSNVATITTTSAHHLGVGDWVYINGAAQAAFNGTWRVTAVPTSTSFQFADTHGNINLTSETSASAWGGSINGSVSGGPPTGTQSTPWACRITGGTVTLQPGTYYGGICIGTSTGGSCDACSTSTAASANVTLLPGTYLIAGGGFHVCGASSLDAPNALIYNTCSSPGSCPASGNGALGQVEIDTTGSVTLGAQTRSAGSCTPVTGGCFTFYGMTIFQDRTQHIDTTDGSKCDPNTTRSDQRKWDISIRNMANGLSGLSGTIYAASYTATGADDSANHDSLVEFGNGTAAGLTGTTNTAVFTGCIFIKGANATFDFNPGGGLAGSGSALTG